MKLFKNNKGFTLVELIVVIVILGVLAGVGAPQIFKYVEKSRVQTIKTNVAIVEEVANNLYTEAGSFNLAFNDGKAAGVAADATSATTVINKALQNNKKLSDMGITITTATPASKSFLLTIDRAKAGIDGDEMGGSTTAPTVAAPGWGTKVVNNDPQYLFILAD